MNDSSIKISSPFFISTIMGYNSSVVFMNFALPKMKFRKYFNIIFGNNIFDHLRRNLFELAQFRFSILHWESMSRVLKLGQKKISVSTSINCSTIILNSKILFPQHAHQALVSTFPVSSTPRPIIFNNEDLYNHL